MIVLTAMLLTVTASADNRELAKEVMAIHDLAMAKVTDMYELKLQLLELEKQEGKTAAVSSAIDDLQKALSGMMRWMREYKHPQTEKELETAESYLLEEKVKITGVGEAIDGSITEAEKLLAGK